MELLIVHAPLSRSTASVRRKRSTGIEIDDNEKAREKGRFTDHYWLDRKGDNSSEKHGEPDSGSLSIL